MKRLILPYTIFIKRINAIREYIGNTMQKNDTLTKLESLISEKEEIEFIRYLRSLSSSTIQYNAIIISLYGCFENYIDDLLLAYTELVFERVSDFEELPKRLKDKYQMKMGEFLSSPHRFRGMGFELEKIVKDYANHISSNFEDLANKKFIVAHSGNMRAAEIIDLMQILGVENPNEKILHNQYFKDSIMNIFNIDETEYTAKERRANKNVKQNEIYAPLDTLVEQRNNVAHGWSGDDRITVHNLLTITIPFLQSFSKTILYLCLIDNSAKNSSVFCDFSDTKPIKVIRKKILCINNQNQKISKGDFLIYSSNSEYKCSEIINLQIDNIDVYSVSEKENIAIGVLLETIIKPTDNVMAIINTDFEIEGQA